MNLKELTPLHKSVIATVSIPGSKSYTNRALIMAALTKGPVKLINPLVSDDTEAMISCLEEVGIKIQKEENAFIVENDISSIKDQQYDLFARISGTTIRFILALACIIPGTKKVYGAEGLNKRPIGHLVDGLKQLGADISYEDKEGYPPVVVASNKLTNGTIRLNGDVSSQFFSALLMIAPVIGDVTIEVEGNQISKSYIDITISMMKEWGVTVENQNYQKYVIKGNNQSYAMKEYVIEGDFSAAGYFFAIGALTQSTITLQNMNAESVQGDKQFLDILEKMGNDGKCAENEITIIGKGVKVVEVDMEQCPDQAQTLAVLAAFAPGKTVMKGIRSLRVKETERVKALETELAKMGIKTESTHDTLTIYGGNPKAATIDTYGDHRMAMSFAVAGTKLSGMKINNPDVVNKTFPDFWEKLDELHLKQVST